MVSNGGKSAVMLTSSSWLNRLIEAGFALERFGEPYPGDEAVRERPGLQDAQVVAYFLHVRARKPAGTTGHDPTGGLKSRPPVGSRAARPYAFAVRPGLGGLPRQARVGRRLYPKPAPSSAGSATLA